MSTNAAQAPSPSGRAGRHPSGLRHFPLRWVDGRQLLLAYAVFSVVGVTVGELITHPLRNSWLVRTDDSIERWLAGHRTPWLNRATFIGSQLAGSVVKTAVTTIVALAMLVVWRRWLEPLMVGVALLVEAAAFITITWIVGRPRPAVARLGSSAVGTSFPSGHTAAVVVYGGIVVVVFWHTRRRWVRVLSVTLVVLIALVVGFSRMYRGMHHLTDVVVGSILGLVAVLVVRRVMDSVRARQMQATPAEDEVVACS